MNVQTIIPPTGNVQHVGLANELVRVVTVDTYASPACTGGGWLHLAHGVRFRDGSRCDWYVTDDKARKLGWVP